MKSYQINTPQFILLESAFKEWLETLGYSGAMIKNYPSQIRALLFYLETNGINSIEDVKPEHIRTCVDEIKHRPHKDGGGLSARYINSIINSFKKFGEFLEKSRGITIEMNIDRLEPQKQKRDILTKEEAIGLIESIDTDNPVGTRTKAIISILYGSGIRKSELEYLELTDISYKNQTIHVRNGKGRKERIAPVPQSVTDIIKEYITRCRDIFEDGSEQTEDYLFIEITGKRMNDTAIYKAVKEAITQSNIESLQDKKISLHTFRHSIATHLIHEGMEIEDVAELLGHTSLDSTSIYLHLNEEI